VNANLIKEEIFRLAQQGATVFFSTHRMEQVEEICDHIVLVNLGKKILDGNVGDIKQQFKENKFNISFSEQPSATINAAFNVVTQNKNNLVVTIQEGYSTNDVLQFFIDQKVHITQFNEILPSLNDIFIQLVEDSQGASSRKFQAIQ
jgi:ABC-2 type transport system ATP-binding protein